MDTNKHIDLGKPVVGGVPRGRTISTFVPTRDFVEAELESVYMKGYMYSLREGNEKLAEFVEEWTKSGLVKII